MEEKIMIKKSPDNWLVSLLLYDTVATNHYGTDVKGYTSQHYDCSNLWNLYDCYSSKYGTSRGKGLEN